MNTTTSAVATGLIVTAGRWVDKKPIDVKIAVGVTFYAILMSVLEDANAAFAGQFALLVLVAACFKYLPKVVKATVGK